MTYINYILAFVLIYLLGCGPKVQYPFLGVDVNAHWFHEAAFDQDEAIALKNIQDYVKKSKFSTLRVGVFWDWLPEHMEAAYQWSKQVGAPEIIFDLFPAPPDRVTPEWWIPWRDEYEVTADKWRKYAREVVNLYPGVIWMIGNEPNRFEGFSGSPVLWAGIYRIFYEEAHAAGAKVIGPSLGHSVRGVKNTDWLKQFFLAGGKVDILAVHPYDRGIRMMWGVCHIMKEMGLDLDVWAVETSGAPDQRPPDHAGYLQRVGYKRVIYHVLGGWRPDRRAKGIDDLILLEREGTDIVRSLDAILLETLGCKMKGDSI